MPEIQNTPIIVPDSSFTHPVSKALPGENIPDEKFYLQFRDINGDGLLDKVGYPVDKESSSYQRPFTIAGETPDAFVHGRGPNQIRLQSGGSYRCDFGKSSCPLRSNFTMKNLSGLTLQEEGIAIRHVEGYAQLWVETFFKLGFLDRVDIVKAGLQYFQAPKEETLRSLLQTLDQKRTPETGFPHLDGAQLDFLSHLAFQKRQLLSRRFQKVFHDAPKTAAKKLLQDSDSAILQKLAAKAGIPDDTASATNSLLGGNDDGNFPFNLSGPELATLDALFSDLALRVEVEEENTQATFHLKPEILLPPAAPVKNEAPAQGSDEVAGAE